MGFAERLSQCCNTSNLESKEDVIKDVEFVAALSGATSLGSDLMRARDYDANALRRSILLLARKARREMNLGYDAAENLARTAVFEILHWQCRNCNGAAIVVTGTAKQVCPKCQGSGVHRWSDHERAKESGYNEDTWPKWAKKYSQVLHMARKDDGATVGNSIKRMG